MQPRGQPRPRPIQKKRQPLTSKKERIDAATLAATFQLQEQQRELIYSLLALSMKVGLLSLGVVSLIKLSVASHQRVERHFELSSVLEIESAKLNRLQERFDRLFTIGGDRRLMSEQDQWISPNRVRVIWR